MQPSQPLKVAESATGHREAVPVQRSGLRSRAALGFALFAFLAATGSAHAKDPGTPTAEHLGLTPVYLQGDWCNTHIQFPSARSPENRNHRFAADGSFAAQTSPTSEMKPGLVYRYRPRGKIGMDGLLYQVKSVQSDEFVLHIAVNDLHFHRGACR